MAETYRFRDIIAPAFYEAHRDLKHESHSEYWFKGGRGSAKSSFVSAEIVAGLLRDPLANAIIYRRVGNTIKDSVYAQMIWAIDMMGLSAWFEYRKSPFEIIYKPTKQRILFRGADDPMKSKSIKLTKGYFKYCWFEELSEFRSMEDVRTILQSVFRGVNKAFTFYSYNPPKSANAWVNKEALESPKERLVHSSTYLDVPVEWLGNDFVTRAETLKDSNEIAYRNEYLGDVTGTGGNVFENVKVRPIPKEELDTLQWFYQGIDWGWFPDPFAWVRCAYDSRKRVLYIVEEFRANKMSNQEVYGAIKIKLKPDESLIADSAEPKSVGDFRDYGAYWIRGANKGVVGGSGSVSYSTKWLASLKEIVIDENKCPETAKEFLAYEYERNTAGDFINGFVDKDNHCLTGETVVNTVDGDFKIKDLVGKSGEVFCYDEITKQITKSRFYHVRMTGVEDIFKIELEDGRTIRCSSEHPILTERGWVTAENLSESDSIIQIQLYIGRVQENVGTVSVGVKRIEREPCEPVYNMEVVKHHNFAVNGGLIVHNCIDAVRYAMSPVWRRQGE